MIFDLSHRSLTSRSVLIPVEELLGNASGSRMPDIDSAKLTPAIARRIADACPTSALTMTTTEPSGRPVLTLDYGECIGCGRCFEPSNGAVTSAKTLACLGVSRQALVRRWDSSTGEEIVSQIPALSEAAREIRQLLGHALNIRQVDAGSCNGCEAEIVSMQNPYYDLERFGIHFVASPKHADML